MKLLTCESGKLRPGAGLLLITTAAMVVGLEEGIKSSRVEEVAMRREER
jgi:hypothetical protein